MKFRIQTISDATVECINEAGTMINLPRSLFTGSWSVGDECTLRVGKGSDDRDEEKKALLNELLGARLS